MKNKSGDLCSSGRIKYKRRWVYTILIIAAALVIGFICFGSTVGWERFSCVEWDVDVRTGDVRSRHYVGFVLVGEKIKTTRFSDLVRNVLGEQLEESGEREWQHDYTKYTKLSPVRIYSWGRFHGAIAACESVVKLQELRCMAEPELRVFLTECLALLRTGDIRELERKTMDASSSLSERAN